ncbi:MAG: hypothetical protein SAL07_25845, partial [Oscillatoria sp. PMC 1051.18]|nr:hypothetical protein [Oscillatoria sp. PMC 1050.18]MEC5033332.1 hypothetical protein [Oscillatoria sp. PMC 1051.18]
MPKRFSRLNYALKTLKNPNADAGDPAPNPPAGSILEKFNTRYARNIVYQRDTNSRPGNLLEVVINPFGKKINADGANRRKVKFSSRASTALDATIKNKANFITGADAGGDEVRGFIPAKAIITNYTGNGTPTDSKITGIKYLKRDSNSWTMPFGASATEPFEDEARDAIKNAALAVNEAFNV